MIINFEITALSFAAQSSRCLLAIPVLISSQIDSTLHTSPSLKDQDYSSFSNLVSLTPASFSSRNTSMSLEIADVSWLDYLPGNRFPFIPSPQQKAGSLKPREVLISTPGISRICRVIPGVPISCLFFPQDFDINVKDQDSQTSRCDRLRNLGQRISAFNGGLKGLGSLPRRLV